MMRAPSFCSVQKLRAALVVLTMLVTLCPQTVPAQNNWQQQQMQRAAEQARMAQESARRAEQMRQQQQQIRQQQEAIRQQQMRQQQAMQQRQMQQQQQRMQWGQRSQQSSAPTQRTIQPWRPSQANVQRPSQGQQRTAQPWQRSRQTTVQRQMMPQRTFMPQRTGITRANQAAAQRRDVFNAQRGVTVRVAPNRAARVLVTRSPNRTEIAQGFRGRYSGDRAVVTVRGKTFTVPRSMVNNRVVGSSLRPTRRPAAVGGNGGLPRRWVLSSGRSTYTSAFNKAAVGVGNHTVSNIAHRANISVQRADHILHGDKTGGGHLWPGKPGKSPFPQNWSENRILDEIDSIASDPHIVGERQSGGRIVKHKTIDGVDIRVVLESAEKGGGVVTAYPVNIPRN